jgi:hypothetical protein
MLPCAENAIKMAEEVDYEEDVDMSENLKVSVGGDSKGRKVTAVKSKGRGHDKNDGDEDRYNGRGGVFENIQRGGGSGPLQCKYNISPPLKLHSPVVTLIFFRSYRGLDPVCHECAPRSTRG